MKKALLVGINYPKTQYALRGCINDILSVNQALVQHLGFDDPKLIRMLTDDSATTDNIIERLNWLVDGAKPGDVLFFGFSGHGSQIPATNYENNYELDGLDECICPIDMNWRDKMITDKTLKKIFQKVPKGVNLTVVLDCCHSGDGLRDFEPPLELRDDMFGPTRTRVLRMPVDIGNRAYGLELDVKPRAVQDPNIIPVEEQTGLLISGCKSNETSADAWIQKANKFQGALTYSMLQLLERANYHMSYRQLVEQLNCTLHDSGFSQHPELNGPSSLFDKTFLQPY